MLQVFVSKALETWASFYADYSYVRTAIGFLHVGGLVLGGGCAIAADRMTLIGARRKPAERQALLQDLRLTHRVVIAGLACVIVSGFLLFAADTGTFLNSRLFWVKMGLFVLLIVNGLVLLRAEGAAARNEVRGWSRLTITSVVSIALWFVITLLGAALPNIG
jgi:uncharacterized membrane protein